MAKYVEILAQHRPLNMGTPDDNDRSVWVCTYSGMVSGYVDDCSRELAYYLSTLVSGPAAGLIVLSPTSGWNTYFGANADIPGGEGPFYHFQEVGGDTPTETVDTDDNVYDMPTVTLAARALNNNTAREKTLAIYQALHGVRGVTITLP